MLTSFPNSYISYCAERTPRVPPQQPQPAQEQPPSTAWRKPQQQAKAKHEPFPQTSEIQAERRKPSDAPPSGFPTLKGPLPSQVAGAPPPGIVRSPPREVSAGM